MATALERTVPQLERDELEARWSASPALLDAALAALEREGLVSSQAEHASAGTLPRPWTLGAYGQLFFHSLEREGEAGPAAT